jgi:hypothetical protein
MKNIEPAREFGHILHILDPDDQVSLNAAPIIEKIQRSMQNFSEDDFLLLSGDPIAIGEAYRFAAQRTQGKFKLLKWDRMLNDNEGGYWVVPVNISQRKE